jgi:putative transcriptional regulator
MLIADKQFDELKDAVAMMARHMRGECVRGMRKTEVAEPDVRAIREAAAISQSEFARLIGINVRTLQNWEQHRSQPTGPARALLKIVASDPRAALKALHA